MHPRTRRKLLLSTIVLVVVLVLPMPGPIPVGRPQQRLVGALADGYRAVIGYPIVGLIVRLGAQSEADGKVADAERDFQIALGIGQFVPGAETTLTGYATGRLADLYRHQRRDSESVPLYRKAMGIYARAPEPDNAQVAYLGEGAARSLWNSGQLPVAAAEAHTAVVLRETLDDDQTLAKSLNLLGQLYLAQRRASDAQPVLQRAVGLLDADPDTDDLDLAPVLNNLGIAQQDLGQLDQAEKSYRRALEIRQDELGDDHPDVAKMLNNLGSLALQRDDPTTAEPLFNQALAIYERNRRPLSLDATDTLLNLARIAYEREQYGLAETRLRRAISIREQLSPNSASLSGEMMALGAVLLATDRPALALPLYQRAVADRTRLLGDYSQAALESSERLAYTYLELDRPEAAEAVLEPGLPLAERMLGFGAAATLRMRVDTAAAYRHEGRNVESEQILLDLLTRLRERNNLARADEVATPNLELSLVYLGQARFAEAEDLLKATLALQEGAGVVNHATLAVTHTYLARAYAAAGRDADAVTSYERALGLQRTPSSLTGYAASLRRLGRNAEADTAEADAAQLTAAVLTS